MIFVTSWHMFTAILMTKQKCILTVATYLAEVSYHDTTKQWTGSTGQIMPLYYMLYGPLAWILQVILF